MAGTLFVVATPIGNLEDITARALRVLKEVSLIAAEDTRRTARLLSHFGIGTRMVSLREHNERRETPLLIRRLEAGESIALVSDAGTPTISDPGGHLIRAAIDSGLRVEPVPGPNAAIAALSVAGVASDRFTFLGFPPIKGVARRDWLAALKTSGPCAVFYEAPHRIRRTLAEVAEAVGDIQVLVARELTKVHETLVRGPISDILAGPLEERGEFTVVAMIGHKTDNVQPTTDIVVSDDEIALEFGVMTNNVTAGRREAVTALARKYGKRTRDVYQAIERHRSSGG